MTTTIDSMRFFPYEPRPHQGRAVELATEVFGQGTVGLLSADCGIGKTVAVLSGYLAVRANDPSARLIVLTRTHSQSLIFESELAVLRKAMSTDATSTLLATTSMVSRMHVCPRLKDQDVSNTGFLRACAKKIRTGECNYYWSFYREGPDGRPAIRTEARKSIAELLDLGVVTREAVERVGKDKQICPYEILRWCARQSRIFIGPYSYLFKERIRTALLSSLGIALQNVDILVDEAHNLSSHVLDSEASHLSGKDIAWLRVNRDGLHKEKQLEKWDVLPRFVDASEIENLLDAYRSTIDEADGATLTDTPLDRLVDFLFTAERAKQSDDWHVTLELKETWKDEPDLSDAVLKIRPLNAAGLVAPVLRGAKSALLMSGTLRPLSHYARLFGISGAMTEDLASPYPQGSRLVLLDKSLTTKYTERRPDLWRAISQRISLALTTMPAKKSALIAFPSYAIMREVLSYGVDCGYRQRLEETPLARIEEVKESLESGPHAIFAVYGGKFSEGVDLVEGGSSMIDLIIGVGIPFGPPTTYQKALQEWYEKKFGKGAGHYYSAIVPSIRRVAQLVGRLRRSPDDWGVIVLLDKRFQRHISVFGEDMVSDVWPYSGPEEMREKEQSVNVTSC
jgi:DNA excision repair protein ERCC-2